MPNQPSNSDTWWLFLGRWIVGFIILSLFFPITLPLESSQLYMMSGDNVWWNLVAQENATQKWWVTTWITTLCKVFLTGVVKPAIAVMTQPEKQSKISNRGWGWSGNTHLHSEKSIITCSSDWNLGFKIFLHVSLTEIIQVQITTRYCSTMYCMLNVNYYEAADL